MIGKPITGRSFDACIRYVLNREEAKIIAAEGVRTQDAGTLIQDFNLQRKMRPELGKAVGHLVLSWSKVDEPKLSDSIMAARVQEYLEKVGIKDTQYVIVRHSDREHPHLHLIYNRVDNIGKTISDKNNFARNIKACKEITLKYGYHMGKGKEQVNRQALRGKEKVRYELFDAIRSALRTVTGFDELQARLKQQGITIHYKYKSGTTEIQGISFQKGQVKLKGSAIDRSLSYGQLQNRINYNQQLQRGETQTGTGQASQTDRLKPMQYNLPQKGHRLNNSSRPNLISALLQPDDTAASPTQGNDDSNHRKRKKRRRHLSPGNS